MAGVINGEAVALLPQHTALIAASAITPEIATACGYLSATTAQELAALGFTRSQQRVPALVVPIHGVAGGVVLHQSHPDHSRLNSRDKMVRYETPYNCPMVLDVPPTVLPTLGDPTVPLFITEGARRADAAVSQGLGCIALLGVWNWRGSNGHGGKTAQAAIIKPDYLGLARQLAGPFKILATLIRLQRR